ncbi:MAG: S46 family peptidase [Pirellulales bacterium]|nr:S46 family peptidase [Pirellulales bacterium]
MRGLNRAASVFVLLPVWLVVAAASADEGMWLFNDLPGEYLKSNYGFEPTEPWADHLMRASVRFNSGGSASFVSSTGLVLTNHHVGADTLQKVSTPEKDYYRNGFYAQQPADEIPAPDLELNQLVAVEDVTERVNAAVKPETSAAEAFAARRGVMAEIEKESLEKTGLRSDVVTLYGGARYHLYRYKKYTDVRLVWAPESAIAFFGGDADNFEYPRYCLDVCIFRVYEDDKPARIEHFLPVSARGVADGELVFVSGNPGRTQRILTTAALKFHRDHRMPYVLDFLRRREVLWQQFGLEGGEQERRARDDLHGVQNSRKAYTGMLQALQNPAFFARRQAEEDAFLAQVAADPAWKDSLDAWQRIQEVCARRRELLGQTGGLGGRLFRTARTLVLMAAEDQKPNAQRLREFRESARDSLLQRLFSTAPLYDDLEQTELADSLALFVERRGGDSPLVNAVLQGKSPSTRAAELVRQSKLADVVERKRLAAGGQQAIDDSSDPMIQLARLLEPEERRLRAIHDELDETERQAYARIADAIFAIRGTDTYPDATFTLRLAFGQVKGYVENGRKIPPWTTVGGAFAHEERHAGEPPWKLPPRWHEHRRRLDPKTPFDFVCTADIIGGNSGSPVVNRDGALVGVIFDGNIQSLAADFFYSDEVARAVSVDSAVILEALRKVYGADKLADELGH